MQKMKDSHFLKKIKGFCDRHRLTKGRCFLILMGIVALVVILKGLNTPHLSPFSQNVTLNHPCSIAVSDDGSVIADQEHTRLIFTNSKQEVSHLVDLTDVGSSINWVNDLVIDGNTVYVLGAVKSNQGLYLESESIEIYSLSGEYERELCKNSFDQNTMETHQHLMTLWLENGVIKTAGYTDGQFYIQTIDNAGSITEEKTYSCPAQILFAWHMGQTILAYGRDGLFYYIDDLNGSMTAIVNQEIYMALFGQDQADSERLPMHKMVMQMTADQEPQWLFYMLRDDDKIYGYDYVNMEESEISTVKISPWWEFKNFIFWICAAYGVVMAAAGIYRVLIVKRKFWQWQRFLILVVMVALVTGVYTYYSYSRIKTTYTDEIAILGKQVTAELQNGYSDILTDVSEQGLNTYIASDAGKERIGQLEQFLNSMSVACGRDVGFFLNVQVIQMDGSTSMLADSQTAVQTGSLVQEYLSGFDGSSSGMSQRSDVNGYYLTENFAVRNDAGQLLYIVESGCYQGNLLKQLRTESVNLLVNLLAVMITLWISYSVLRDIPKSIHEYKAKMKCGDPDAPVKLSGIFTFVHQMVTLIDAVILVYVIRSMVSDSSLVASVSAVVMAVFQIGMIIGNLTFFQLRIRKGERKIGMIASVGAMCAYALMSFAVAANRLGLMILGKFFSGVFIGSFLLILTRGLPLGSKNEKTRSTGLNENQQAYTASAILSALLAGYLSQYLSYAAVYLLGAVLCLPMIFLSLKGFKPGIDVEVRERYFKRKAQYKGIRGTIKSLSWMFYKTPAALIFIVFYTFPFVLTNGYATYLFPLYSAGAGISALLLSNIAIFGQAIAYYTNRLVLEVAARRDRLTNMVGYMLIMSVCFLCFAFTSSIWWAIAVLFVQYILLRIPRVGTTVYLSELAEKEGYHPRTVQPTYYSIEGIFNTAQAPVLKGFISFGVNYACMILGAFCSTFIGIFTFLNRKIRKKGLEHDQGLEE